MMTAQQVSVSDSEYIQQRCSTGWAAVADLDVIGSTWHTLDTWLKSVKNYHDNTHITNKFTTYQFLRWDG